jgi:hypothetical protein
LDLTYNENTSIQTAQDFYVHKQDQVEVSALNISSVNRHNACAFSSLYECNGHALDEWSFRTAEILNL